MNSRQSLRRYRLKDFRSGWRVTEAAAASLANLRQIVNDGMQLAERFERITLNDEVDDKLSFARN